MRVHVVSDVHGSVDALERASDGADALVCLGDLVLFLDYADSSGGIFAELFGGEISKLVNGGPQQVAQVDFPASVEWARGKLYASIDVFSGGGGEEPVPSDNAKIVTITP